MLSDFGGVTTSSNRDSIGTISIADSIKLSDKKFKKTTKMQEILRHRFETTVLDLVLDYLRIEDLASAWRYLNAYYCSVLRNHIDVFAAALEVYKIKPQQSVTEYIWCLEIVNGMCNEIMSKPWNDDKMIKLLEKGLKFDSRFSAMCTTIELLDNSVAVNLSYLKLKEKVIAIDLNRSMERDARETMMNALRRSHWSGRDNNTSAHSSNRSNPARINTISKMDPSKGRSNNSNNTSNNNGMNLCK